MFAGQVGIAGHLKIADGVKIGAKAGIPGDIKEENSIVMGIPAFDIRQFKRSAVVFKQLPEMKTKIESLGKEIELLKRK